MQALDKETFSYWVTHPDDLTPTDFAQMKETLQTFPYCQALHTLAAKAASVHQKGQTAQTITYVRQAAAYALSRNALRKLIDNEFQWSDNLLTKLNELSARHVPIPEDYQQESYALFKSKAGLSNGFPKMSLIRLPEPGSFDKTNGSHTAQEPAVTTPTPDDPTLVETNLQHDLAQKNPDSAIEPVTSLVDPERQRQQDLIDSFIQNEPQIPRIRNKVMDSNEPQEDLTKRSQLASKGGLVTEAFAIILQKQGKIDKAVEIYQQLILKNPQKKAYFAAKISELTGSQVTSNE
ncbi:hypothetical protein DYU11_18735 [Fibrisoma montanum]|uniref:Tetratricopeptide repeat protein n=1 Tax=Fibrisoma montanum TaxID=2305895 RepID=A0A418M6F1_9BACT|nr:hypothetical protein [Fibrisoma montanum]RIV21444.1 hypothetical protein DYU11_18735 [Fibrisoma montanum]